MVNFSRMKQWSKKVVLRAAVLALVASILAGNHFTQASTACVRNTAADRAWVKLAYERVAGRQATNDEVVYVAGQLANRAQYQQILTVLADSDSRLRIEVGDTFETLLGRQPDAAAMRYWSDYTKKTTVAQTTAKIASSPEYFTDHGNTNAGYVTGLFQDLLHRSPSTSDVSYWAGRINGGMSRSAAALHIANSEEARMRKAERLYLFVLHRPADIEGRRYVAEVIRTKGYIRTSQVMAVTNEFWNQAQQEAGLPTGNMPAQCKPVVISRTPWKPPVGVITNSLAKHPDSAQRLITLTFDDGPNTYTPEILNILRTEGVKATFFVVGTEANHRPETLRRIVAEGHTVANHTMTHARLTSLSTTGQRNEIIGGQNVINGILGAGTVKCMRPPYGASNNTTLDIARERGMAVVNWSRDSDDWAKPGTAAIIANSTDSSRDGGRGVILMHDRSHTKDYLPQLIRTLKSQGYVFVSIC